LLFKTDRAPAPYCYRCPFNRARPERADARLYRQCQWECTEVLEQKFAAQKKKGHPYAAFVFEPLMQGAAGMVPQPEGWLRRAARIARAHGALLVADEVLTGFGRTGPTFACQKESVGPDLMALAKGMTGGYMPMAATLATQSIFNVFLGRYEEFKTFFHGHSYTANQLGAAASLASLRLLESAASIRARVRLQKALGEALQNLWSLPNVGDIRQVGLMAGVELVKNWKTRAPFALRERAGLRVCEAMARRGVLTRPVGNVIVLMPPYCTTPGQVRQMAASLSQSVEEVFGAKRAA
jgi:adenosylmethionine-8-amino-7-oxononanoate aminotransferase